MTKNNARDLVSRLGESIALQAQLAALHEVLGFEIRLVGVSDWPPHKRCGTCANRFCEMMIQAGEPCLACADAEEAIEGGKVMGPQSVTCLGGLCQTAVPLRASGATFGFVEFGPITLREPTERQFQETLTLLRRLDIAPDRRELRRGLFATPTLSAKRHEAIVRILILFAQQASLLAQQIHLQRPSREPSVVAVGKKYITEHKHEALSLPEVARAAKVSTSYFSRMFKKTTEQSFTDYLARVRIEQAEQLLNNPDMHVSEVAYAVGFQSIPHFNRVFKRLTGKSPSQFRSDI